MSQPAPDLSDETRNEIAALVRSGHFASADAVVREGLGWLEWRATTSDDEKLQMLRAAVQRGIDDIEQGRFRDLPDPEALDAFFRELTEDVIEREGGG